jgi:hypothetical protein
VIGPRINECCQVLTTGAHSNESHRDNGSEQRLDEKITPLNTLLLKVGEYPRERLRIQPRR